jgi:hypothetical protein
MLRWDRLHELLLRFILTDQPANLVVVIVMKTYLIPCLAILAFTSLPTQAGKTISGSLKLLSPQTNKIITSARVGSDVKISVTANDLNLVANKETTFTYALSVMPDGSNTPVIISGKFSAKVTLPESEGGAARTRKDMAGLAGAQTATGVVTIPDFMPAGKATISLSVVGAGAGAISLNRSLTIRL